MNKHLNKEYALPPPVCQSSDCSSSCCASTVWTAGELKDQGNIAFKAGRLKPARSKYTKALRLADRIFDLETEEQVSLHFPLAYCSESEGTLLTSLCWSCVHVPICPCYKGQLFLGWSGLIIRAGVSTVSKILAMQALPDVPVSSKHSSTVSMLRSSSLLEVL